MKWAAGLLPALMVAACTTAPPVASAASPDGVAFPPVAVAGARPAPVPLTATLSLPPGDRRVPVVILLHGCGGVSGGARTWVRRLNGWGYGALVLDSFTARGVRSVCGPGQFNVVSYPDRVGDVVAAARFLQARADVDGSRLAVLGMSHGGRTAAEVADAAYAAAEDGRIKGTVDYYGSCGEAARYGGMPMLAMAGDADDWGNPARRCRVFEQGLPPGMPFELAVYSGAVHSFDSIGLKARIWREGHAMQYDPEAAEDSFRRVHAFLDRVLGAARP